MLRYHAWSISLGRWGSVDVRLHMFFLVFAACTLFLSWESKIQEPGSADLLPIAGGSLILLLASVMLHEGGHYLAATRLGGGGDQIVLGPLGGLKPLQAPFDPTAECWMHLAGPLANLAVCVASAAVLFALQEPFWGLLSPLAPQGLIEGSPQVVFLKLTFWINGLLALVNFAPVYPFDGARALRAGLLSRFPEMSTLRASAIVAFVAKLAAGLLVVLAWTAYRPREPDPTALIPLWFCLILLAIFLFFSAKHEEETQLSGGDRELAWEEESESSFTGQPARANQRTDSGGTLRRWLDHRRQAKMRRLREIEVEEERRVDEILARLHHEGIQSLSDEERALLQRVSHRYRQRNNP